MPGKLFITDLDGTLLRDDKTIGDRDSAALERLGNLGICRAAATGRSLYSFLGLMENLKKSRPGWDLPLDYVIFSTGAGIMDYPACSLLKTFSLNPGEVVRAAACFEEQGLDYMVHRPVPDTREFMYRYQGGDNPDFLARISLYKAFGSSLDGRDLSGFGPATELLAILPPAVDTSVVGLIRSRLDGLNVIRATSPLDHVSTWVEVFPATVSKSRAAAWLAGRIGVDPLTVMSVGNDYNDVDLLEWSGRGLVVANAPGDLRCRFVTVGSNNECGMADAIAQWL
ncbi:MAG: HAD family hydrolase [Pseudomonadota bacterium]